MNKLTLKIPIGIVSIGLCLIILEVGLRILGTYSTFNEKTIDIGTYIYIYKHNRDTWFHTWKPNTTVDYKQSEFRYQNKYNDLGHRDVNFSEFTKDSSDFKIVCLGDSFTEGDGAPYDSTWVSQLSQILNATNTTSYSLYNAGVCGSDVIFNQKILFEELISSKPDLVIECINNSDIQDLIHRGGLERFNSNGSTTVKRGPKWETIYKFSHTFRALIRVFGGYDSNLINKKNKKELELESIHTINQTILNTAQFCLDNNIKYKAIIQPVPNEIKNNNIGFQITNTEFVIDLRLELRNFYKRNNIKNYSWEKNGHFNAKGYLVLGDIIYEKLLKSDSTIFNKNEY